VWCVSCSICLTEYSERESLRTLPCAHHFHQVNQSVCEFLVSNLCSRCMCGCRSHVSIRGCCNRSYARCVIKTSKVLATFTRPPLPSQWRLSRLLHRRIQVLRRRFSCHLRRPAWAAKASNSLKIDCSSRQLRLRLLCHLLSERNRFIFASTFFFCLFLYLFLALRLFIIPARHHTFH
jgi:hypothetical protein